MNHPNSHKPKPHSADTQPARTTLEVGKQYRFCTCGHSTNQPFCNGAHKSVEGTPFSPLAFTAEKEVASMCMCKHTQNPPYCDGSHKNLT